MRKYGLVLGMVLVMVLGATVYSFAQESKLQKQIDTATVIVSEFRQMPENSIPPSVLKDCKGLAIITVVKGGFIIGVRGGSGIVIAKDASGAWTAPSSVGMGGGSIGFQIGAEVTDFILVLNTDGAVDALSKSNCTLGADASIAAGPVGRTVEADMTVVSAIFAYSRSKGLFAGVSLEGAIITEEKGVNEAFYGRPVSAGEILSGSVPPPASASALYDALAQYGVVKGEVVTETVVEPVTEPVAEPAAK